MFSKTASGMRAIFGTVAALGLVAGMAQPVSAQVTYNLESRFGVTYERDGNTGESRMRPGAQAMLTVRLNHQFDNGLRVQLALGVDAGNLRQRGHPHGHGLHHGHRAGQRAGHRTGPARQ